MTKLGCPYVKPKHMTGRVIRDDARQKCEVGFTPKYQKNFEGLGINSARYAKNFQNAKGICKTCPNVIRAKLNTVTGEHCKLRFCDR